MNNIHKACLGSLYFAQRSNISLLIFGSLKSLVKILFFRSNFVVTTSSDIVFVHNSNGRPDLLEDFYSFYHYFKSKGRLTEVKNLGFCLGTNFKLLLSFKFKKDFTNEMKLLLSKASIDLNLFQILYLKIRLLHAFILLYRYESQFKEYKDKIIILHKEMEFLQNIIASTCKKFKIRCISLQHGFYEDAGDRVNLDNVVSINYLANTATEIWCWGESTKKLFEKYTSACIFIIGIPKTFANSNHKFIHTSNIVVFDSSDRFESNDKLHEIRNLLEADGLYHPDDSLYKPRKDNLAITATKTVIGCHSSLLIHAALFGCNVLLLPESRLLSNNTTECKSSNLYDSLIEFTKNDLSNHVKLTGEKTFEIAYRLLQNNKFIGV